MMLGVRGFPANSINHANSFFVPQHSTKVFVAGEVDMVASVGYNPARLEKGWSLEEVADIRFIFTNLCVMDFGGPDHQVRLVSLHPGVTVEQVQEATGFAHRTCPPACPPHRRPHAQSNWPCWPSSIPTTCAPACSEPDRHVQPPPR